MFIYQRRRTQRHIKEYELKIQALKNEVHEAWMSVQDANRQNEKLQNELDCRSFHVDSLGINPFLYITMYFPMASLNKYINILNLIQFMSISYS